jgi:hypothetical protein
VEKGLRPKTSFLIHERGGDANSGYVTVGYWAGE